MNIKCLFGAHVYTFKYPDKVVMMSSGGYCSCGYICLCDNCNKPAPFEVSESEDIPILQPR